ncbi:uncharacterized protein LOC129582828 [Paramacrobiotus metropolitanus]|uniref:uncharacterized protein LOC129582828 n=1 Tax=Paramacrobiotus metropolitanus TaxID=2943436 RepID=UPI0024459138|nr:uncharacterized protein LOC129582828 [Paramacrobiotus metropolitanus]
MMTFMVCMLTALMGVVVAQKFPLSPTFRCNPLEGKFCRPDVCENATCQLLPTALCVSDKCGCRKQFYYYVREKNTFFCVTKLCQAATDMEESQSLMRKVLGKDQTLLNIISHNPALVSYLLQGNNMFGTDVKKSVVDHLKAVAEQEPTDANLQRYQTALHELNAATRTPPATNTSATNDPEWNFWSLPNDPEQEQDNS